VVTLADVMPTVLDMTGLPIPAEVQGRSLVPLFFAPEKEIPGIGFAYSETYYPRFHYGWSDLKSYQDRRFKLILAPDLELYDVASDPQEQKNLAGENPQEARDLYALATQFLERTSRNAVSVDLSKMDEETKQRLSALGYVGSFADTSKLEGQRLLNPREKIGVFNALNKSREMGMEGKADDAVRDILAIIADDPELVDAYFTLGNIYYKEKRFKDSLQAFRQALRLKPDDSFTVINMANCLTALGRSDEAEKAVLDFLAKGFQDSQLYHLLGGLNFARKRYDQAIVYFEKCLTLNTESAASHNSLAAIYIVKGDLGKAEAHIREALKINPRLHTLYFNWAQLYEKQNDPQKAAEAYLKEMEISPRNFRACFNLARVYRQLGRDEDELTYLNKTKALNPDFGLTYFYLARIELNRGRDYDAAVALVQKGLALKPEASDLPLGYFLLADLYNRLGQDALSQEYARKGQEAARTNPPQR
jgi:tetratricopeptide (TPR) repeat protein